MTTLAPYRAVISARFRMLLQYRVAALAGLFTQIFFGFVLIMVYEAFYRSAPHAALPLSLPQVVTYVWLGQALLAMLPWNGDPELRKMIRSGAVAYELTRPVDLYALWYARAIAFRTAPTLLRAVPMVVFAMVVLPVIGFPEWQLAPPVSLAAAAAFVATLALALALACAITTLLHISLLWTVGGEGSITMISTVVTFFSGMLIPLPLFPAWAQTALRWLPFSGLVDAPFRIYNGNLGTAEVPLILARQLGWLVVLVALGRWLLARGMRLVVVQGG